MYATLDKEIILNTLAAHSLQLLGYGVLKIGLFGSYVSGNPTETSDIDLLVDLQREKKTFQNFMHLCYYLEELLGKKVDLVTTQSLSPYIGPHILNTVEYVSFAS